MDEKTRYITCVDSGVDCVQCACFDSLLKNINIYVNYRLLSDCGGSF